MLTGFPSAKLEGMIDTVTSADGLIAVTPVFTTSYSGLFKSFFDVLDNQALDRHAGADGRDRRAPRGTRWCSTTRCARCSPTCTPWWCRPGCSRHPSDWGSGADKVKTLHDRIERAAAEFAPLVAASTRSSEVKDPFALDPSFSPTGSYVID